MRFDDSFPATGKMQALEDEEGAYPGVFEVPLPPPPKNAAPVPFIWHDTFVRSPGGKLPPKGKTVLLLAIDDRTLKMKYLTGRLIGYGRSVRIHTDENGKDYVTTFGSNEDIRKETFAYYQWLICQPDKDIPTENLTVLKWAPIPSAME